MLKTKRQSHSKVYKPVINRIIPLGLAVLLGLTSLLGAFLVAPARASTPSVRPYPYDFNTATSLQVVVNKSRPLNPINYAPVIDKWLPMAVPTAVGYRNLKKAMTAAGVGTLCLNSGYRSFATQTATYNKDVARFGKKVAENLAALSLIHI